MFYVIFQRNKLNCDLDTYGNISVKAFSHCGSINFESIAEMKVENSGMSVLNLNELLKLFPTLKEANFQNNAINKIVGPVHDMDTKLEILSVDNNPIMEIEDGVFDGLMHLKKGFCVQDLKKNQDFFYQPILRNNDYTYTRLHTRRILL